MKKTTIGFVITAILTAAPIMQTTASAETELFADSQGAKTERVDNMRHVRYIELFFPPRIQRQRNLLLRVTTLLSESPEFPNPKTLHRRHSLKL